MTARVVAAFFGSGGWKAGTPVAMASVPVRATAPDANARRTRITPRDSTALPAWLTTWGSTPSPRTTIRKDPIAIISRAEKTKR